jgi:uncharacterized protein (TIGR02391 family)
MSVLRWAQLDSELWIAVRDDFRQGRYADAVLAAMRVLEQRVRQYSGLTAGDIGVPLMRRAFGNGGALEDTSLPTGEPEARAHLVAGAIGYYGSPTHHRNVVYSDPQHAAEVILTANELLRQVEAAARANGRI